jgi:hypothetical protein
MTLAGHPGLTMTTVRKRTGWLYYDKLELSRAIRT